MKMAEIPLRTRGDRMRTDNQGGPPPRRDNPVLDAQLVSREEAFTVFAALCLLVAITAGAVTVAVWSLIRRFGRR